MPGTHFQYRGNRGSTAAPAWTPAIPASAPADPLPGPAPCAAHRSRVAADHAGKASNPYPLSGSVQSRLLGLALALLFALAGCGGGSGSSNSGLPTLGIANTSRLEGDSGSADLLFTLSLSSALTSDISIDYATADGSALSGVDYQAAAGTLSIPAGSTSATIPVPVIGDTLLESDETFTLTLSNPPAGISLARAQASGTILNDEQPQPGVLQFEFTSYQTLEAGPGISYTVTRTGGSDGEVSVLIGAVDGTALQGQDYNMIPATATFPDGDSSPKSGNVIIFDDNQIEPDETFTLTLSNPTGGATLGANASAVATILDDDTPPNPGAGFNRARGANDEVTAMALAPDSSGDLYIGGHFTTVNRSAAGRIARLDSAGGVNTAFKSGDGFDGAVLTILPLNDGSGDLYVGGDFTHYNGTAANRLVRLNGDGSLDSGFDAGSGFDGDVRCLALSADGSGDLYVGGDFQYFAGTRIQHLARLNLDGSLDTAFDPGSGPSNNVRALLVLNDGSGDLYAGGEFQSYDSADYNRLLRLHADGSIDTGFNPGFGFDAAVMTLALATDGSGDLFVGGWFTQFDAKPVAGLARLTAKGELNTSFTSGGLGGFVNAALDLVPLQDGSGDLYVAGGFEDYAGVVVNGLARLAPSGTLRPGFDTRGEVTGALVARLLLSSDGDLYAAGWIEVYQGHGLNHLLRLNGDGTADAGFAVLGAAADSVVRTLAVATDGSGKLYVGGDFTRFDGASAGHLARLNEDGTLDSAFATGSGFDRDVTSLALATDGSGDLFAGGLFTSYDGIGIERVARLRADGSLDKGFVSPAGLFDDSVYVLAADGSGGLYAGGRFSSGLVHLNSDGSLDAGFDTGGGFKGTGAAVFAIAPSRDGSGDLYVAGFFDSYGGTPAKGLVRLNSDGSLDTGFAVGSGIANEVMALVPANDGSGDLYVGGWFTSYDGQPANYLLRLNNDGSIDTGFTTGSGFDDWVYGLALAGDGSGDLYVGGSFGAYAGNPVSNLARLHPDGSLETAFDSGAGVNWDEVDVLAAPTDGSGDLFAGGYFTSYGTTTVNHLVRVNADGSPD